MKRLICYILTAVLLLANCMPVLADGIGDSQRSDYPGVVDYREHDVSHHNAVAGNDETITTPDKVVVFKIGDYNYYIVDLKQNKSETVKMDTAPQVYPPGRTFVPVRFLGNALGVDDKNITWDSGTNTATLKSNKTLKLQIGSKTMYSDSNAVQMDVAPIIQPPGRTMLPARYVAEGLGYIVEWDAQNQLVIAYPEGQPKPDFKKVIEIIKQTENPVPPATEIKVQDLGSSTGVQYIKAEGYNLGLGNHPNDPTMFFNLADKEDKLIRVVCTSHPEFNKSIRPLITGGQHERRMDVWTNNYMLFREGYTTNPQSGMTVTFDIYGGYNGDESYEGVKIATIRKTLP